MNPTSSPQEAINSPIVSSAQTSNIMNPLRPVIGSYSTPVRVTGLNKWEGLILEVDDELMIAELTPLGHVGPTVVADFETHLLGEDAQIVTPGDVFYLTVRTVRDSTGYPSKTEHLRLRRLGVWTEDDVARLNAQAQARLDEIEDLFG
ncbi:hypothetical protein AB0O57_13380 [Streptomyces sp. NPDC091201]|uniref:hypothetical protein n=1 Tax=Streptomyces sp. NPDC091201 TaxID=3155190 RepID=UPI00343646E2